ncbi:MAG: UDP-N-acetylmuramoyl-L-alanyl-D-glutamate--2,6-diaminopimelate ligase [bacterium]|nr:UDP-N-acetylmuramoyl-L-alanyl-D-glutamate--2,6-diaminopimelate ligase [bacterium]
MKLTELVRSAGLRFLDRGGEKSPDPIEIGGIAYDSRRVRPGDLFIAIRGEKDDGHRFIPAAAEKGAAAVLGEDAFAGALPVPYLRVENSRAALALLAAAFLQDPSRDLILVGVTGTSGKTTTTYLIESILRAAGLAPGLIGTVEYRYAGVRRAAPRTTPESWDLQNLFAEMKKSGAKSAVMEVSSHALVLDRVRGCAFNGAVFTNLTPEHLDFHRDLEDYFAAKRKLFMAEPGERKFPGFFAVVNLDDAFGERLASDLRKEGTRVLGFSAQGKTGAEIRPRNLAEGWDGIRAQVETPAGPVPIDSKLLGHFNLENILGAVGAGVGLALSPATIARGIADVTAIPGRLERVETPGAGPRDFQVLVDYAHKPDALDKVLTALAGIRSGGRLITVFGCGGDRDKSKRSVMGKIAAGLSDLLIVTSDNPRSEDPLAIIAAIRAGVEETGQKREGQNFWIEPDREKAIRLAVGKARKGDLVLVAGKGHETEQIIGKERLPFDDRAVAARILAERSAACA